MASYTPTSVTSPQMNVFDAARIYAVALYVAFSGIYWLPGIPSAVFSVGKLAIFSTLLLLGLLPSGPIQPKELNLRIVLAVAGVFALIASTWTSDFETSLSVARNYIEPLLWLIALSAIPQRHRGKLIDALTLCMFGFVAISLYPILAQAGLLPNFNTPADFFSSVGNEWEIRSSQISNSGFAGLRTGWGVTVATGGVLAATLLLRRGREHKSARWGAVIVLAVSAASIAVTGARGGLVALLTATAFLFLTAGGRGRASTVLLCVVLLTALATDIREFVPANLFRGYQAGGTTFERLDSVTTNRFSTYVAGANLVAGSPLVGVGPENARVAISDSETRVQIHNLWLRIAAETGLVSLCLLLLCTLQLLSLVFSGRPNNKARNKGIVWPDTRPVIVCALVLALVEPNVIIGSFNINAAFWTAVWIVLNEPRGVPSGAKSPGPLRDGFYRHPPVA